MWADCQETPTDIQNSELHQMDDSFGDRFRNFDFSHEDLKNLLQSIALEVSFC